MTRDDVQSLTELLQRAGSQRFFEAPPPEDLGLAELMAFPFLAIVGQQEMKLALILSLIAPTVGGVLLIGSRGTGKTTAARSLTDLLPTVERSRCTHGCLPEDISYGGMDAVCPDCAQRYGQGEPLTYSDQVRLIELPLNARLEDVIGGLDERAALHNRMRLSRGILAQADRNILYVDEVNLLTDEVVDAILDAASQGSFTVHRGPTTATYRSRFVLVGSMNPEEGSLRPQILDRFGLRVIIRGLEKPKERLEAYRRTIAYQSNPRAVIHQFEEQTNQFHEELMAAREAFPSSQLSSTTERLGLKLIRELGIESIRAEITLFESARAYAVADGRLKATPEDLHAVAPLALRLRRSQFLQTYLDSQDQDDKELDRILAKLRKRPRKKGPKN